MDYVKGEINSEIERIISNIRTGPELSGKEYLEKLTVVDKLIELKAKVETEDPESKFVTALKTFINNPALMNFVGGMGATVLVLYFERTEVITSKAFSSAFNWIRR